MVATSISRSSPEKAKQLNTQAVIGMTLSASFALFRVSLYDLRVNRAT